jgi:NAD(P)-dependent dehydrogenase (short-subunit alcohol dehydrogenase family)
MNNFDLNGDTILVTGADGGIGAAIVAGLRAAGAAVIGTDLREHGNTLAHDVTKKEDWTRIAEHIRMRHGKLTGLVNNAGTAITESLERTTLEQWRRVQAVNVESIVLSLHTLLPLLREGGAGRRGGASVVNMSSVGGLRGAPFNTAYCASKAAVLLLSKSAAQEYAALGEPIRVNTIHPGGIDTAMMNDIMARGAELAKMTPAQVRQNVEIRHPMRRLGQPDEIAGGVIYLCSTASSFVTGTELAIDGGYTSV